MITRQSIILAILFIWLVGRQALNSGCYPAEKSYILTIGDSNGEGAGKWPEKLAEKLGAQYKIINDSQSGRTIGFDNLGDASLNTLKQIDTILVAVSRKISEDASFDKVLICLGTNDCKAVFDDRQQEVSQNLAKLVKSILTFNYPTGETPEVVIISPPPYGRAGFATEKYKDGDKKVKALVPQFEQIAEKFGCQFINIYTPMLADVEKLSSDGIHFTEQGYDVMAELIKKAIKN